MADIPSLIQNLLSQFRSIDIAESEFMRILDEDSTFKADFTRWCEEMGYKERTAFSDYCHEYIADSESIFDTLSDYND